jgi:kinesin family member 6/9
LQEGSDLVRKANLNLVDLAGSERVSRTNSDGMLLKEAKYINLSLHYLEQVIIALQVCSSDVSIAATAEILVQSCAARLCCTGTCSNTPLQMLDMGLSRHHQERSTGHGMLTRPHVPYRNSVLTAMLKDSLGGNCTTAMLATISSETSQLEESIATCRFAQRVAMITNEVLQMAES